MKKLRLLQQGSLLFISTLVVNVGNYAINLILGRTMGPSDFSEVSLLVTLMLMLSFWALAFQLTAAKYAAEWNHPAAAGGLEGLLLWLRRLSWSAGSVLALLMAGLSLFWKDFFHCRTALPFIIFGAGMPLYFVMSANRGLLQGRSLFARFAATYQTEMWSRLLVTMALVAAGLGINGVAWGITVSLLATLLVSRTPPQTATLSHFDRKPVIRFFTMILVYECSQILINNSDILLVKHFFTSSEAGLYAALALVGRIVYFGTWTVVTLLFPAVIRLEKEGKPHMKFFLAALAAVGSMGAAIVTGTYLFPAWTVNLLFGPQYLGIAPLLWLYALATTLFACANVFVYYNLSLNRNQPAWFMIAGGALQILLICLYHDTFRQVIGVQIILMGTLLILMMVYQSVLLKAHPTALPAGGSF